MSANTQLSDSHKELDWWNGLNDTQKKEANTIWPRKSITSLTTSHIIGLYRFHFAETKKSNTSVKEGEEGFTKGEFVIESIKETNLGYVADIKIINNPDSLICSVWGDTKEEAEANAHLIAAAKDLYFNNDKNIDLLKELQRLLVYGNINLEQTLCKVNERLFKSQEVRAKANPKLP